MVYNGIVWNKLFKRIRLGFEFEFIIYLFVVRNMVVLSLLNILLKIIINIVKWIKILFDVRVEGRKGD